MRDVLYQMIVDSLAAPIPAHTRQDARLLANWERAWRAESPAESRS